MSKLEDELVVRWLERDGFLRAETGGRWPRRAWRWASEIVLVRRYLLLALWLYAVYSLTLDLAGLG